jgi:hypothetical protein
MNVDRLSTTGTTFTSEVLLALTMAFALALLGTTTWFWSLR